MRGKLSNGKKKKPTGLDGLRNPQPFQLPKTLKFKVLTVKREKTECVFV